MEIYLLRHGQAEDRVSSRRDADRKLTPKGKRDVRRTLALAKVDPQLALSSGLRRADETAAIASPRFTTTQALIPTANPESLWAELRASNAERILVVGHEPHLSHLVSYLLGATIAVHIKKGAMLCVEADGSDKPQGVLQWMITPRLAKRA